MKLKTAIALTALAMIAFAANSLLCRLALQDQSIDPASFTALRLISGALTLWLLLALRGHRSGDSGSWRSAAALFAYAAAFSFAYVQLSAATGALVLFGAVQLTMIGVAWGRGERLSRIQTLGLATACAGLVGLLLPGLTAPPMMAALLMALAGGAWGMYSLRGRGSSDALASTTGNFLRSAPLSVVLWLVAAWWQGMVAISINGVLLAVASGALASAIGYAIWYSALPSLRATTAATVQLSVPLITAIGAVALLGEPLSLRLAIASVAILGGVAGVILFRDTPGNA